jgi:hypothetical protein
MKDMPNLEFNFTFNKSKKLERDIKESSNLMKNVQLFSPQQKSHGFDKALSIGAHQINNSCRTTKQTQRHSQASLNISEIDNFEATDDFRRLQSESYKLGMLNLLQGKLHHRNKP